MLIVGTDSFRQVIACQTHPGTESFRQVIGCSKNANAAVSFDDEAMTMIQTKVHTSLSGPSSLLEQQEHSAANATIGADLGLSLVATSAIKQQPLGKLAKHMFAPSTVGGIAICMLSLAIIIANTALVIWMFKHRENPHKKPLELRVAAAFLLVVFILAAAYMSSLYIAGLFLKRVITEFDMAFLGVNTKMQNVLLNPFNGVLMLNDLEILNPAGYNSEYLLRAKTLEVHIDMLPLLFSLFKAVDVSAVKLSGVHANYEQALTTSNVLDLVKHLQKDSNNPGTTNATSTKVKLHEVSITDCWVKGTLHMTGNNGISVAVPDLHYKDFDKEVGEEMPGPIIDLILGSLLKSVLHTVGM